MKTSTRSFALRVLAVVLALWLLAAGGLTWAVAQDFQEQIYDSTVQMMGSSGRYHGLSIPEDTPGYESLAQIEQLSGPFYWLHPQPLLPIVLPQTPSSYSSKDWFWDEWELLYGYRSATMFFDEAGKPLVKSGNLLTMFYVTAENWTGQNTDFQGAAYIDLDKLPNGAELAESLLVFRSPYGQGPGGLSFWTICSTGYFQGEEFIPVTLDAAWTPSGYEGPLQWKNMVSREAPADRKLVTIYTNQTGGIAYDAAPVTCNGKRYDSLVDFALEAEPRMTAGNLFCSVFTVTRNATESTGADACRVAIYTRPLRYAALRLTPFYLLGSLAVGLCLWLLLLRPLRRQLSQPLAAMGAYGIPVVPDARWQDVRQVEEHIRLLQDETHSLQGEKQQLQAALDYAKHAEENRRQLVSNITHELKTPLAVIHSYAEGLQAGIAQDKQGQYLQTILEESEKMDAMVLEMLDLSRLEAGKVRLSADTFSLLALAREILNKLAPEETRRHDIAFSFSTECIVTADEGRIGQVITNLISNALKYTPDGGKIWLQVLSYKGLARFRITNQAQHLPEETLEKLFESFYRADASRSDKGTGLGLPIARSIIQLHRGTVTARNVTEQGEPCLEFTFEIPLQ